MEMKNRKNEPKAGRSPSVPQMQVRSDLRSGGDLETCQFNLEKWRDRYDYWYNLARQRGKI
jgi:hypothetical protein